MHTNSGGGPTGVPLPTRSSAGCVVFGPMGSPFTSLCLDVVISSRGINSTLSVPRTLSIGGWHLELTQSIMVLQAYPFYCAPQMLHPLQIESQDPPPAKWWRLFVAIHYCGGLESISEACLYQSPLPGAQLQGELCPALVRGHVQPCFDQKPLQILGTNLLCLGSFEN